MPKNDKQIKQIRADLDSLRVRLDKLEVDKLEVNSITSPPIRIADSKNINEINACNFEPLTSIHIKHDTLYAIFRFPDGMYRGRCKKHFEEALKHNISMHPYITVYAYRPNKYNIKD